MVDMKQAIVVRRDLKMRKGKLAGQVAHASLKVFSDRIRKYYNAGEYGWHVDVNVTDEMKKWLEGKFTKIVLGCETESDIFDLEEKAKNNNIPCAVVRDAGDTVFNEPTITCIAIGPDSLERIDGLTKGFKLL